MQQDAFDVARTWASRRRVGHVIRFLLARADRDEQRAVVGQQFAGRVGFFLRVDDFDAAYERMQRASVEMVAAPRTEPYGRVVVFKDIAGNRWNLLGP